MVYIFVLRNDMPPGFIENHVHPLLPAGYQYLQQYDGRKFQRAHDFEKILREFPKFLEKSGISRDSEPDTDIRQGLCLSGTNVGFLGGHYGMSVFGELEKTIYATSPKHN